MITYNKKTTKPKVFLAADYEHVQLLIYTKHRGKKLNPHLDKEKNVAHVA